MPQTVCTGLARLVREGPSLAGLARDARVGLLAHPASIGPDGRHAIEWLETSSDLRLVRLFVPEHGLWGHEQDMEAVGATVGSRGLPVVSLYGTSASTLRPDPDDLAGLDAILCDLQDVGSRYYTFVYTISYVMEAAGAAGVPVIVLDRPNPIGGVEVEGPILDPAMSSFVGRFPMPVRHGLTTGELAKMFREAYGVRCDLNVVAMTGWRRQSHFNATSLPWVPPSPNMPTPRTALVYPGGCLIEGTNLSEGRGTTTPFELVGAPWLDPWALADRLRARALPGVGFRAASFRPMFQKHAGSPCGGVQVIPLDCDRFRPFETYLAVIEEARDQHPQRFDWRREPYEFETDRLAIDLLLGKPGLRAELERRAPIESLSEYWRAELESWETRRREWLIYPY